MSGASVSGTEVDAGGDLEHARDLAYAAVPSPVRVGVDPKVQPFVWPVILEVIPSPGTPTQPAMLGVPHGPNAPRGFP